MVLLSRHPESRGPKLVFTVLCFERERKKIAGTRFGPLGLDSPHPICNYNIVCGGGGMLEHSTSLFHQKKAAGTHI